MRYRAKPLEIEAVLWNGDIAEIPSEWVEEGRFEAGAFGTEVRNAGALLVTTLEGPARADAGEHYIVRGTVGEFYPVRRDIFEAKYTAALDE